MIRQGKTEPSRNRIDIYMSLSLVMYSLQSIADIRFQLSFTTKIVVDYDKFEQTVNFCERLLSCHLGNYQVSNIDSVLLYHDYRAPLSFNITFLHYFAVKVSVQVNSNTKVCQSGRSMSTLTLFMRLGSELTQHNLICGQHEDHYGQLMKLTVRQGADWPQITVDIEIYIYRSKTFKPGNACRHQKASVKSSLYILSNCGSISANEHHNHRIELSIYYPNNRTHYLAIYLFRFAHTISRRPQITCMLQTEQESVRFIDTLLREINTTIPYSFSFRYAAKYMTFKIIAENVEHFELRYFHDCHFYPEVPHFELLTLCNFSTANLNNSIPLYAVCVYDMLRAGFVDNHDKTQRLTTYDSVNDTFYIVNRTKYTSKLYFYGPMEISYNGAKLLCQSKHIGLLEVYSLKTFARLTYLQLKLNSFKYLHMYSFQFWIVNIPIQEFYRSPKTEIGLKRYKRGLKNPWKMNCQNIKHLRFKHSSHIYCKQKMGCKETHLFHVISDFILEVNDKIFCTKDSTNENIMRLASYSCSVVLMIGYCREVTLLYIPCHLKLVNTGVVCTSNEIEEESLVYAIPIKTLFLPSEKPIVPPIRFRSAHDHRTYLMTNNPGHEYLGQPNELYLRNIDIMAEKITPFGDLFYRCKDYNFILNSYTCDGKSDCPGGEDEANCTDVCTFHQGIKPSAQACFILCKKGDCECSLLYFQCALGGCIPASKICDCVHDCLDGSDEDNLLCSVTTCGMPDYIFTKPKKSPTPVLSFINCLDSILSEVHRHSLGIQYICNGKNSCLNRMDEWYVDCSKMAIVPAFKCIKEQFVIPLNLIVDRVATCYSSKDDEMPRYFTPNLPEFCKGKGLVIVCSNATFYPKFSMVIKSLTILNSVLIDALYSMVRIQPSYMYEPKHIYLLILKIVNTAVNLKEGIFDKFTSLTILTLSNNSFTYIAGLTFQGLQHLSQLTVTYNYFHKLENSTFQMLPNLTLVDLSNSFISYLPRNIFSHNNLKTLKLRSTFLTHVTHLEKLDMLEYLDVSNTSEDLNTFADLDINNRFAHLDTLYTVHPEICCILSHVTCSADVEDTDAFSTCKQKTFAYACIHLFTFVNAILVLATNGISIYWHVCYANRNTQMYEVSQILSDLLMGLYLLLTMIGHQFNMFDRAYGALEWGKSVTCKLAAIICFTSMCASRAFTLVMSTNQYVKIVRNKLRAGAVTSPQTMIFTVCTAAVWTVSIGCAGLLLLVDDVENDACFPIGSLSPRPLSLAYTIMDIVLVVCTIAVTVPVIGSILESNRLKKSEHNKRVIYRLCCRISNMFLIPVCISVIVWMTFIEYKWLPTAESVCGLIIIPVYSWLNPLIHTLTTVAFHEYFVDSDALRYARQAKYRIVFIIKRNLCLI